MPASVSRLPPRLGSFPEALADYRAARLQLCLSKLHNAESFMASTLRARAYLRLGNPDAALHTLANTRNEDSARSRDRGEIALLQAVAFHRLKDNDRSRTAFQDAHAHSISAADPALEAEVEFYEALTALGEGHLHYAREACQRGLDIANAVHMSPPTRGYIPVEHVVSRTHELLGVIDAAEGRYGDLLHQARKSLVTHDNCTIADVYIEAFALRNLAVLARDFDMPEDAELVSKRVPAVAWTEDVCRVEFTAVEALGWCSALRGDSVQALRHFRQAEFVASTTPERILVGVDRALIAREFGHRALVIEEIEHALYAARRFNWENAAGDYRVALLTLAQATAATAPEDARQILNLHTSLRNSIDSTFAARIEPRARAEEAYTQGLVLRAEGRLAASAERLESAFETWDSIGYEWRAARAALELAELNAGEIFRLAVRRELFKRPNSIFSDRARLIA
jgi:hypothetical protein